jgi:L,D-peptidoglycan transpeptidase YkuD (ErfK/YbiS/YcfS/YnhG family)
LAIGVGLLAAAAGVVTAVWWTSARDAGEPNANVVTWPTDTGGATELPQPEPTSALDASPSPRASGTPVGAETLPERIAYLPRGTRQIIVITGSRLGAKSGRLRLYEEVAGRWIKRMSVPADFGANGLVDGLTRTAGHLQTPTGIWRIGSFLFGQHATPPPGTVMPYRPIEEDSWWSAEADSTYNTWVTSATPVSGEHLADAKVQYEYAFNSGYNSRPNDCVPGRGTAIFIHCSEPPGNSLGRYTHGCIAIDRIAMRQLFAMLVPALRPTCAIGTLQEGSATSIWAY